MTCVVEQRSTCQDARDVLEAYGVVEHVEIRGPSEGRSVEWVVAAIVRSDTLPSSLEMDLGRVGAEIDFRHTDFHLAPGVTDLVVRP